MKRHNESGYILIGTILAIVLLAVVGLSLTSLATFSIQTSSKERDHQSVYYIAEAGLNYLANEFESATNEIFQDESVKTEADFYNKLMNFETLEKFSFLDTPYDTFEKVNGIQPYAELSIEKLPDDHKYRLISTGHLGDESRTVSQVIEVEWQDKFTEKENEEGSYELPPFAVFTKGNIEMRNGTINGDVGTVNENKSGVRIPSGGPMLNGIFYVPNGEEDIVDVKINKTFEIETLEPSYQIPELPPFPQFPEYTCPEDETIVLSAHNYYKVINNCDLRIDNWVVRDSNFTLVMNNNLKFNEMRFNENIKLRIDVQDTDREIVVNHLNMENGHIELLGTGNLTIYVLDQITMNSGSTINLNGDVSRLNIYLKGTGKPNERKEVKLTGSQKVYGSLYAEDADIRLDNGGGFVGNIFTGGKNFKIVGGSYNQAQLFFAPNALFDMTKGGEKFEGMIITDQFFISGGWQLYYKELQLTNGPISPAALGFNGGGSGGNGGSGGSSELIETGNKPNIYKSNIREVN